MCSSGEKTYLCKTLSVWGTGIMAAASLRRFSPWLNRSSPEFDEAVGIALGWRTYTIEPASLLRGQFKRSSRQILLQLGEGADPQDHTADDWLRTQPCQRDLSDGSTMGLRNRLDSLQDSPIALGVPALPCLFGITSCGRNASFSSGLRTLVALILAREKSSAQWSPCSDADSFAGTEIAKLIFNIAIDQAVLILCGHKARPVGGITEAQRFHHLPGLEVRDANVAHFPCSHQIIEYSQCFFQGSQRIPGMQVIHVNVVRLQPT